MRLGCRKCNKMLGEDLNDNLYVIATTDWDITRFRKKPAFDTNLKCPRCNLVNKVFGGTS